MIHRITAKQWAAMLEIHLTAPFRMVQVTLCRALDLCIRSRTEG